jgi:hypothetical protein
MFTHTSQVEMLADRQEIIRNEALLLLQALTTSNPAIQKIIAFNGAFERLMAIVSEEGNLSGGIIVEDCLHVVENLVRNNRSNQTLFCEAGCVRLMPGLVRLTQPLDVDPAMQHLVTVLPESQVFVLGQAISIVKHIATALKPPSHSSLKSIQSGLGLLNLDLLNLSASAAVPAQLRLSCVVLAAAITRAHNRNQRALAQSKVVLPGGTRFALPLFLELALEGTGQERSGAELLLQCYFAENTMGQLQAVQSCTPSPLDEDTDGHKHIGQLLIDGLMNRRSFFERGGAEFTNVRDDDWSRPWKAARVLAHILRDNSDSKHLLLRLPVILPSHHVTSPPQNFLDEFLNVLFAVPYVRGSQHGAGPAGQMELSAVCLLLLLCEWMDGCLEVVRTLVAHDHFLPFVAQLTTGAANVHLRGLSSFVIGLCLQLFEVDDPAPNSASRTITQATAKPPSMPSTMAAPKPPSFNFSSHPSPAPSFSLPAATSAYAPTPAPVPTLPSPSKRPAHMDQAPVLLRLITEKIGISTFKANLQTFRETPEFKLAKTTTVFDLDFLMQAPGSVASATNEEETFGEAWLWQSLTFPEVPMVYDSYFATLYEDFMDAIDTRVLLLYSSASAFLFGQGGERGGASDLMEQQLTDARSDLFTLKRQLTQAQDRSTELLAELKARDDGPKRPKEEDQENSTVVQRVRLELREARAQVDRATGQLSESKKAQQISQQSVEEKDRQLRDLTRRLHEGEAVLAEAKAKAPELPSLAPSQLLLQYQELQAENEDLLVLLGSLCPEARSVLPPPVFPPSPPLERPIPVVVPDDMALMPSRPAASTVGGDLVYTSSSQNMSALATTLANSQYIGSSISSSDTPPKSAASVTTTTTTTTTTPATAIVTTTNITTNNNTNINTNTTTTTTTPTKSTGIPGTASSGSSRSSPESTKNAMEANASGGPSLRSTLSSLFKTTMLGGMEFGGGRDGGGYFDSNGKGYFKDDTFDDIPLRTTLNGTNASSATSTNANASTASAKLTAATPYSTIPSTVSSPAKSIPATPSTLTPSVSTSGSFVMPPPLSTISTTITTTTTTKTTTSTVAPANTTSFATSTITSTTTSATTATTAIANTTSPNGAATQMTTNFSVPAQVASLQPASLILAPTAKSLQPDIAAQIPFVPSSTFTTHKPPTFTTYKPPAAFTAYTPPVGLQAISSYTPVVPARYVPPGTLSSADQYSSLPPSSNGFTPSVHLAGPVDPTPLSIPVTYSYVPPSATSKGNSSMILQI